MYPIFCSEIQKYIRYIYIYDITINYVQDCGCNQSYLQAKLHLSYLRILSWLIQFSSNKARFEMTKTHGQNMPMFHWAKCEITREVYQIIDISNRSLWTCIGIIDYYSRLMTYSWTHWWHIHICPRKFRWKNIRTLDAKDLDLRGRGVTASQAGGSYYQKSRTIFTYLIYISL